MITPPRDGEFATSSRKRAMSQSTGKSEWTEAEAWAWQEIAAGRIADFNGKYRKLDPLSNKGWNAERTLGAPFLRAILFDGELRAQVPVAGVRIAGARWTGPLDLTFVPAPWPLCLDRCRFEAPVDLTGLQIERRLSAKESAFQAKDDGPSLKLSRARIRWADLADTSFANGIAGANAAFDGALDLSRAAIAGKLDLERATMGSLFLLNSSTEELVLNYCEIERHADLSGVEVKGAVRMGGIQIGQDLLMGASLERASLFRQETILIGAFLGGGIDAMGATFKGRLGMNAAQIGKHVFLRKPMPGDIGPEEGVTAFDGALDLSFCVIGGHLELIGATIKGPFSLSGAQLGENLNAWSIETSTTFGDSVSLQNVRIRGQAGLTGAVFQGKVDFAGAKIDGNLSLSGCRFEESLSLNTVSVGGICALGNPVSPPTTCTEEVDMQGMTVCGQLQFKGQFCGEVKGSGLKVGSDLILYRSSPNEPGCVFAKSAHFADAEVSGSFDLCGAIFEQSVAMARVRVGADLKLGAEFRERVELPHCRVEGSLDAADADFQKHADLSGSKIGGRLCLRLWSSEERSDARLDLRDAHAASLQIARSLEKWPKAGTVDLDGFTYGRLGGTGAVGEEMIARQAKWFEQWLELDQPYSPQPYEYLATIFRHAGETGKANRILYAGRNRARAEALSSGSYLSWLGLTLLWAFIGYGIGYRFFMALVWAVGLTVVGTLVLGPQPIGAADGTQLASWLDKAAYSFDQLLPIIELDRRFSAVELPERVEHYFYGHRVFGYILGSFIAAGVAGLTQRSRS